MTTFDPATIDRLRADTPGCAEWIHLNNAGAGLMPRPVIAAMHEHIDLEARVGGYEAAAVASDAVRGAYAAVAQLIGCRARNIAFVENATVAYAQALSAIPLQAGDTILTTTNDYISNQLMLLAMQRRLGVAVRRVADTPEGEVDVDALRDAIRAERPAVVALTHVPTNSGLVQPVADVGRVCAEAEVPFLLDACQALGQLPIDVAALHCDFLAATSRKFLRGPRGAGFLYVSDRALEAGYEPLFIDMRGARWTEADAYRPVKTAARFENWEFAYALVLGTGAAAEYAAAVGVDAIAERARDLGRRLREGLAANNVATWDRGADPCAIVTASIPGWKGPAFERALRERGINSTLSTRAYAVIDFTAKGVEWVTRLSPHYYNTEDEVDTAVEVVAELGGR